MRRAVIDTAIQLQQLYRERIPATAGHVALAMRTAAAVVAFGLIQAAAAGQCRTAQITFRVHADPEEGRLD